MTDLANSESPSLHGCDVFRHERLDVIKILPFFAEATDLEFVRNAFNDLQRTDMSSPDPNNNTYLMTRCKEYAILDDNQRRPLTTSFCGKHCLQTRWQHKIV